MTDVLIPRFLIMDRTFRKLFTSRVPLIKGYSYPYFKVPAMPRWQAVFPSLPCNEGGRPGYPPTLPGVEGLFLLPPVVDKQALCVVKKSSLKTWSTQRILAHRMWACWRKAMDFPLHILNWKPNFQTSKTLTDFYIAVDSRNIVHYKTMPVFSFLSSQNLWTK